MQQIIKLGHEHNFKELTGHRQNLHSTVQILLLSSPSLYII